MDKKTLSITSLAVEQSYKDLTNTDVSNMASAMKMQKRHHEVFKKTVFLAYGQYTCVTGKNGKVEEGELPGPTKSLQVPMVQSQQ